MYISSGTMSYQDVSQFFFMFLHVYITRLVKLLVHLSRDWCSVWPVSRILWVAWSYWQCMLCVLSAVYINRSSNVITTICLGMLCDNGSSDTVLGMDFFHDEEFPTWPYSLSSNYAPVMLSLFLWPSVPNFYSMTIWPCQFLRDFHWKRSDSNAGPRLTFTHNSL